MDFDTIIKAIRELGSFGVLIGGLIWVGRSVWPKISAHLDTVTTALTAQTDTLKSMDNRLGHIEQRIEIFDRKNDAQNVTSNRQARGA